LRAIATAESELELADIRAMATTHFPDALRAKLEAAIAMRRSILSRRGSSSALG
jgi:hypothetical protein